jgi:hypothetical protein
LLHTIAELYFRYDKLPELWKRKSFDVIKL